MAFFTQRADMVEWFELVMGTCHSSERPFMPLEVVYNGQRCGFYAGIECYTP